MRVLGFTEKQKLQKLQNTSVQCISSPFLSSSLTASAHTWIKCCRYQGNRKDSLIMSRHTNLISSLVINIEDNLARKDLCWCLSQRTQDTDERCKPDCNPGMLPQPITVSTVKKERKKREGNGQNHNITSTSQTQKICPYKIKHKYSFFLSWWALSHSQFIKQWSSVGP